MNTLRSYAALYRVLFRTEIALEIQYRAAVAIWLIGAVLEPLIYLVVWNTVAAAQGGAVEGFTTGDFAAYFIVGMVVNQLTFTWIMWEYDYYIREGVLSSWLLRPVHPIHRDFTENLGYKLVSLVILIPAVLLLTGLFRPTAALAWWSTLAFVPALLLAILLRFALEWVLAMAAFWTTRTHAINQLYFVVFLFFSGRIAPLALFPAAVAAFSLWLPFRWFYAFPIELLLGQLTPREALVGLGIQTLWLAAIAALLVAVWRAGVRRFGAVGG